MGNLWRILRRIETKEQTPKRKSVLFQNGAGDEARTRYLHLGKVALYQMSYTRETWTIITVFSDLSIGIFKTARIFSGQLVAKRAFF